MERRIFILILGVKILLLFSFLFFFGETSLIWSDSTNYIDLGKNIFEGHGFSTTYGVGGFLTSPDARRMPLYPFFLGFFDAYIPHGLVVVSFFQAIAAALTAVFLYRIGRLFLSSRWALAASLVFSLEPLIAVMHILIMPETLFVLFVLIFLWYFLEYLRERSSGDFFLSVAALGAAAYTKPIAIWLFAIPVFFILFTRRGVFKAFVFAVLFMLLLSPWMIRNYFVVGTPRLTTNDLGNLCGWELGGILATKHGIDSSNFDIIYSLPEYVRKREQCTSASAALKMFLFDYPGFFVKTSLLSSASLLTNEGYAAFFERPPKEQVKIHHNYLTPAVFTSPDWRERVRAAIRELTGIELIAVLVGKLFWLLVSIFAFIGMAYLSFVKKSLPAIFLMVVVVYFVTVTVISTGYGVGARLRYPIDPALLIFALHGIWLLIHRFRVVHR